MSQNPHDDLSFAAEDETPASALPPWTVLVVDDEPDVHAVTRLTLETAHFETRAVRLLFARSAAEARTLLRETEEIALILLDVVMESDDAGLKLVRFIREELGNADVRIVLRTGQPGVAPPRAVIEQYGIDDYRSKTELTSERLYVSVAAGLRTFALLQSLRQAQERLQAQAYAASHQLQTPLRAIVGFTQLLQRRHSQGMDETGRELLASVAESGTALSALIRELLENQPDTQAQGS